ncbi:MAG: hypothetical protein AB1632_03550 [Nitrospirota bacterium]
MKKYSKETYKNIVFGSDNTANMKKVMACYKNVLVCGIKGVGKITHTIKAIKDNTNVYYIGNPVDHEGKTRPGSYEKYLEYILSLKKDLQIIGDIRELLKVKGDVIIVIDEIYGRSDEQLDLIDRLLDMENAKVAQIVGCVKYMRNLINKIDITVDLQLDGAFMVDRELTRSICSILGMR